MNHRLLPLALLATALPAFAVDAPALTNPQMSLILDGVAYADDIDGTGNELLEEAAGISHAHAHDDAHEHGGIEEGFNLRGAELVLSATVDQLFDAYANLAFAHDSVELEEAWFSTRALPAGWQVKGGKFFSGFGYANAKHPHSWDFVDQNLAYLSLLGDHGINDTGVQVTWMPATDTWMQFGAEILQGDEQEKLGAGIDADALQEMLDENSLALATPFADNTRRGPQLFTLFAKTAPDLGTAHALQLGVSYARHTGQQEAHEEGDPVVTDILYAEGNASILGLEAVYKRAATGRNGVGALRASAEYLRLDKDLAIVNHTDALEIGGTLTGTQDALYVQGVYGFAPRWEAGLRYDVTGLTNETSEGGSTETAGDSSRLSAVVTFRASEFSALRLQLSSAQVATEAGDQSFGQVMLQYNLSLGAHGAHTF